MQILWLIQQKNEKKKQHFLKFCRKLAKIGFFKLVWHIAIKFKLYMRS